MLEKFINSKTMAGKIKNYLRKFKKKKIGGKYSLRSVGKK